MKRITLLTVFFLSAPTAHAEPLDLLASWEGTIDYFITGAPLAADGPDSDGTRVDLIAQPASVDVTTTDVPGTAVVVAAYLFWGGTVDDQDDCDTAPSAMDDEVVLTVPGGSPTPVTADECFCDGGGARRYDMQACRVDITTWVTGSGMIGTFTVDEFDALIDNESTDNASFALLLVFDEPDLLPPRRIALYDGLEGLYLTTRVMNLSGLDADTPAHGDLAWYVLEGDVGGASPESVELAGVPGGASTLLSDSINPVTNPMNHTINTTSPPRTDSIGVDIDSLDASAGLTPGDTAVDMTYTAGGDKYWVVLNIVGINVYRAHIPTRHSWKHWDLHIDADADGRATPGDTIRYTIHLVNVGTAPGYVDIVDDIPSQFESWALVDAAGGTDSSTATQLIIEDIFIAVGGSADIVFDAVIGPGTLGEFIVNTVVFDAGPDGNMGNLAAPPVEVGAAAPDEEPEPVPEPDDTPDAATDPDVVDDTAPDPSMDTAADPDAGTDPDPPPQDQSTGCGCVMAGQGNAVPTLLALLILVGLLGRLILPAHRR